MRSKRIKIEYPLVAYTFIWENKKTKKLQPLYKVNCNYCNSDILKLGGDIGKNLRTDAKFTCRNCIPKIKEKPENKHSCKYCGKQAKWKKSKTRQNRGKYCSRKCYNEWQKSEENIGPNNPNYIDGGRHETHIQTLRKREPWKLWRKAVYERDNYTCQFCGIVGGKIHPHHIKFKKQFPQLIYEISNGITLCEKCHMQLHRKNMKVENILLHIVKINEAQMMH